MNRIVAAGAAMAVLVSAIVGYRIGAGSWPGLHAKQRDASDASASKVAPPAPVPSSIGSTRMVKPSSRSRRREQPTAASISRLRGPGSRLQGSQAGRGEGRQEDPLLPQPHGPARHLAGAEEGLDGDGLHRRLRGRGARTGQPSRSASAASSARACAPRRRDAPASCGQCAVPGTSSPTSARCAPLSLRADGFIESSYVTDRRACARGPAAVARLLPGDGGAQVDYLSAARRRAGGRPASSRRYAALAEPRYPDRP